MRIENPGLRGCNPDPSILRVGDDYYIATSTFEWFPGVQVHYSRDLVHWRLLTRPLTRVSQLDLKGVKDSGGVWAPCLTHHDGTYFLVYASALCQAGMHGGPMNDLHNFLVTAPDITGPWSEPVHLVSGGFDPSLFHDDDGRKWLLWAAFDYRAMYVMQSGQFSLWLGLELVLESGADGVNPFKWIMMQEYSQEAPGRPGLRGHGCPLVRLRPWRVRQRTFSASPRSSRRSRRRSAPACSSRRPDANAFGRCQPASDRHF